ncbi:hypothetical protein SLA2020_230550 [Shorea laevis]
MTLRNEDPKNPVLTRINIRFLRSRSLQFPPSVLKVNLQLYVSFYNNGIVLRGTSDDTVKLRWEGAICHQLSLQCMGQPVLH